MCIEVSRKCLAMCGNLWKCLGKLQKCLEILKNCSEMFQRLSCSRHTTAHTFVLPPYEDRLSVDKSANFDHNRLTVISFFVCDLLMAHKNLRNIFAMIMINLFPFLPNSYICVHNLGLAVGLIFKLEINYGLFGRVSSFLITTFLDKLQIY